MNRTKAPIDNKNIVEDFVDDFTKGDSLYLYQEGITRHIFLLCDCLCELSYRFGQHWFKVRIIEGEPHNVKRCSAEISEIVESYNSDNVSVSFNPYLGVYEFYFVEF